MDGLEYGTNLKVNETLKIENNIKIKFINCND